MSLEGGREGEREGERREGGEGGEGGRGGREGGEVFSAKITINCMTL